LDKEQQVARAGLRTGTGEQENRNQNRTGIKNRLWRAEREDDSVGRIGLSLDMMRSD
jgi:hypothetical protein